ncbi:MAG: hypothetical protein WBA91_08680 [Paracoccaceae bacterium]
MFRLIKALLILAIVAFAGLVGFAYLADMAPPQSEVVQPVELNVQ